MSDNLVIRDSKLSPADAVKQLKSELETKGIKLFAHIDHSAAARSSGLELDDEHVLIFGDPGVGTKLMQEQPKLGIELPLKILVWDGGDCTKVAYREPLTYLEEFKISSNEKIIEKMSALMSVLVDSVTKV